METVVRMWGTVVDYLHIVTGFDVIDVAIVAFMLYRSMLILRRSRSAQVAKAILFIVALMWVSHFFRLNVLNFILGRAVELGFLALIIVFQPEIRRFLEQVGSSTLSGVFGREETPEQIDSAISQVVEAFTSLSKDECGALVVFERKTLLDDIIVTGTTLDAAVTGELLKNIFWPNAPMHDGAVIIRAGRVAGAGCMLPLSSNVNLSRDLGMRHRAGIGISETSDAVVAIVSEETGSISVSVGGMLKRHLAPETFERLLRNELIQPRREEPQVKAKEKIARFFRFKWGVNRNDRE